MRLSSLFLGESDDDGYCSGFSGESVERPYTASLYEPVRSNLIAVVERRVRTYGRGDFKCGCIGLELGYGWSLGDSRHLSVSIGGVATRMLDGGAIPKVCLINLGRAF